MEMKKYLLISSFALLFLSTASIYAQCDENQKMFVSDNLILNPGFEQGNVSFESDQKYFGNCSDNNVIQEPEFYSVPFSGASPFDCNTFWSANIFASEGDRFMISDFPLTSTSVDLWCQKIEVVPNSDYEYKGDFINVLNPIFDSPDPIIQIEVTGDTEDLGIILNSSGQIRLTEGEEWENLSIDFNTGQNTEIKLCIQNTNEGNNGNDVGFDNFSLRQFECDTTVEMDPDVTTGGDFLDCDEVIDGSMASIINGSFEEGSFFIFENGSINQDQSQIDGWSRAAFDRNIQITDSGHNGVPAYEGETYSRVNAISNSSIYQDIATMPGDILRYSFAHRGGEGVDQVIVYFGIPRPNGQEPIDSEIVNVYATGADRWVVYEGVYEVPAGQTITRFSLGALSSSNGNIRDGNLIDAVTVQSIEASCENPMRGNVEICDNGIDDDNDGLIDANDPDCSTSGGNNGGLESNGRLAEKIFKRSLDRRIEPNKIKNTKSKMLRRERTATYGIFGGANERSIVSIEEFIPLDTISNTETYISSPTDLVDITNATEVYSVDIFRDDRRLAAIFATSTENGVYEHTKYICDRLKGGIINDIETMKIGGANFIVTDLIQPEGNREFALSFSARENKDGYLSIESHWSLENYPNEENYYNFQIWASNIEDLKALTLKTLQLLYAFNPITNVTTSNPPSVFVSQGEYKNGKLELKIINKAGSTSISVEGERSTTETSSNEAINSTTNISGDYSEFVSVEVGSVYDMGFRINHANDTVFDDLFIADGLWFIDTQEDDIQYEVNPAIANYKEDAYQLERSIQVSGSVTNSINVYRSIKPNFVSVDLSDFNTLHFDITGKHAMQIILVKKSVTEWENQYKTSITTSSTSNEIDIPLSRFSNGSDEAITLNDIQAVIFRIENGGVVEEINLEISNLEFRNQEDTFSTESINTNSILASPNPSTGNVNITWRSESEGIHNAIFTDINGRTLQEFRGLTSNGLNQIVIERNNLQTGIYFFSIVEQSGEVRSEKIVLID